MGPSQISSAKSEFSSNSAFLGEIMPPEKHVINNPGFFNMSKNESSMGVPKLWNKQNKFNSTRRK